MATKTDFTEQEWSALQKGMTGSGMLVSLSDRDLSDSFGEASAMGKYLAGAQVASTSELVRELAPTTCPHCHNPVFRIPPDRLRGYPRRTHRQGLAGGAAWRRRPTSPSRSGARSRRA